MTIYFDAFPHLGNFAIGSDHKRAALDAHPRFAILDFLPPCAVFFCYGVIRVRQQREVDLKLVPEFFMAFHAVRAYAEDNGTQFL